MSDPRIVKARQIIHGWRDEDSVGHYNMLRDLDEVLLAVASEQNVAAGTGAGVNRHSQTSPEPAAAPDNVGDQAEQNTDREIWREREGDYYADSIHVTEGGGIGMNCGGHVIVLPIRKWHAIAERQLDKGDCDQ